MHNTKTFSYTNQKIFFILASCCGLLFASYMFLVGFTVSNTLARQQAEQELVNLQTTVSELEFAYVNVTSDITLEKAKELGFVEVSHFSVARNDNVAFSR